VWLVSELVKHIELVTYNQFDYYWERLDQKLMKHTNSTFN